MVPTSVADTWCNDAMPYDAPRDCLPEFRANAWAYHDRIQPHRGATSEVSDRWSTPIGVLFIDGDHSYDGYSADIVAWIRFVRQGGWVAFHDSGHDGVKRAIDERFAPVQRYSELRAAFIFAARKRGA